MKDATRTGCNLFAGYSGRVFVVSAEEAGIDNNKRDEP